jgi:xanthine dehydrogenase molybdenum-binding subunit
MSEFNFLGKNIPRADAADKVAGKALYIHDLVRPGMLFGKIKYSEYAHARIKHIDTSKAEKLPGVRAAVAATSPDIAEEAVDLIKVEYEELPGVFKPEDALKEDAPLLHEFDARGKARTNNLVPVPWKFVGGDVEKAKQESAYIVEDDFQTQLIQQSCMGTAGCIAEFDLQNNLIIHSKTQIPFLAQNDFNRALVAMGIKGKNTRVILPTIGGSFGTGLDTHGYEYICILLAYKTGKPVKIVLNREEK